MPTNTYQEGVSGPANSANVDNYIQQSTATTNRGTEVTMRVGRLTTSATTVRALLTFDISDIPVGATIMSATLTFVVTLRSGTPSAGSVFRLRRTDWDELGSTWNEYRAGSSWTTAGCGDTTNDYDTANPGTHTAPPAAGNSFDVTGLATLAQDALDNRSGLLHLFWKLDTEANNTNLSVGSSDNATAANRPLLSVTYSLAGSTTTSGMALLGVGRAR